MDDDLWRQDGSFRGISDSAFRGNSKKGAKSSKSGPQFTRVIPKFLQKYQQIPAIMAKFESTVEDEVGEEEMDEVQEAAINAYMDSERRKEKGEKVKDVEEISVKEEIKKKPQKRGRGSIDSSRENRNAKRQRQEADRPKLDDKRLLSFTMEEED